MIHLKLIILIFVYWFLFLGLIVRVVTVGYTPANTSGRNTETQVADTVNQLGIYSTVRHPLYVGNFLMYLGLAMLTHNIWFVLIYILVFYLYYERIMFAEEQFLRKNLVKFIPNGLWKHQLLFLILVNFRKPIYILVGEKFWKRKEWFGSNVCIVLFILFNSKLCIARKITIDYSFWFISTCFSLILYIILKYLKYNSNILNEEGR